MYNGIGLTTPRGSGTNGYVQRNLSSLRVKRPRDDRGGERDEKDRERLESQLNRQPNAEILEHQRKRQLEVKCAELQDMMEEQGWARETFIAPLVNVSCIYAYIRAAFFFFYFSILSLLVLFRYTAEEIEEKVNSFRMMLQEKQEPVVNTNERPT